MKPVVGSASAYFCTILSIAAIIILSVIALLFWTNHESMMGSINDPENGKEVATTIMGAVVVYGAFFLCCGTQVLMHRRQSGIELE